MEILLEAIFALVSLLGGLTFWVIVKKDKLLRQKLQDEEYLHGFLRKLHQQENFSSRTQELEPLGLGYCENLALIARATKVADTKIKIVGLALSLLALVASVFLGWLYLMVNFILFLLAALFPIRQAGINNALTTVLELAQILYKWNKEKPAECAQLIGDTRSFAILYRVAKNID